jgi:hypothetical protein
MPYELFLKEILHVGTEALFPCDSNQEPYAVVFEDDGETGYFYGCAVTESGLPTILDALHIYNVNDVLDRDEPSEIKIGWSPTGMQAILLINDHPHAVLDFENQCGFCRTGFPPVRENSWCRNSHQWEEDALRSFR